MLPAPVTPLLPAQDPASIGDAFATREELTRFAEEHRVQHELARAADGLLGELARTDAELYWLRATLSRLPLRDVGSLADAQRHLRRELAAPIAQAVHRALHRAAAAVREGLA